MANAGTPDGRQRRASAAAGMGVYELVQSEDAAGPVAAVDLESGSGRLSPAAAAVAPRQRLVSLDVFRGITVLVRDCRQPTNLRIFFSLSVFSLSHIFLARRATRYS